MTLRGACTSILTFAAGTMLFGTAHAETRAPRPKAYVVRSTVRQMLARDIAATMRGSGSARLVAPAGTNPATQLLADAQQNIDAGNRQIALVKVLPNNAGLQIGARSGAASHAYTTGGSLCIKAGDLQLAAGDKAGAARSYKVAVGLYDTAQNNYSAIEMPDLSIDAESAKNQALNRLGSVAGAPAKTLARR